MFLKLLVMTPNNVVWVNFSAALFNERHHVVKTSMADHVPFCYEVINFFTEPQNFLLMFLIRNLKGVDLIFTVCDGLLMIFLYFLCTFFGNFNCTIQINEDIIRIFCPPKGAGVTDNFYFRPEAWRDDNSLKLSLIFLMARYFARPAFSRKG